MATKSPSTGKVRRNTAADGHKAGAWRADPQRSRITPAVPVPTESPQPWGGLACAPVNTIVRVAGDAWGGHARRASERRRHVRAFLRYLTGFKERSWQQRWDACAYAAGGLPTAAEMGDPNASASIAFRLLVSLRVVRPRLASLDDLDRGSLSDTFLTAQCDVKSQDMIDALFS